MDLWLLKLICYNIIGKQYFRAAVLSKIVDIDHFYHDFAMTVVVIGQIFCYLPFARDVFCGIFWTLFASRERLEWGCQASLRDAVKDFWG